MIAKYRFLAAAVSLVVLPGFGSTLQDMADLKVTAVAATADAAGPARVAVTVSNVGKGPSENVRLLTVASVGALERPQFAVSGKAGQCKAGGRICFLGRIPPGQSLTGYVPLGQAALGPRRKIDLEFQVLSDSGDAVPFDNRFFLSMVVGQ